jgi:hypothetical protein
MRSRQEGMTLVELLVMICIVCLLMVLGAVHLLRARGRGYEASAVASLRVIAQGQVTYSVACGMGGFAPNLQVLSRPMPGGDLAFIPEDLGGGMVTVKSGYLLLVRPAYNASPYKTDCNGTMNTSAHYASARPLMYGVAGGMESYAVSLNGAVWAADGPTPPADPFGPPSYPLR